MTTEMELMAAQRRLVHLVQQLDQERLARQKLERQLHMMKMHLTRRSAALKASKAAAQAVAQ